MTNSLKDTPRHQGLRNQLVQIIAKKGIKNEKVLKAMSKVPRHLFMDSALEIHAYEDKPFPIAADQTISQPYTVAFQTELLDVKPQAKILEIGTGSGYQTAVLMEMEALVYTVERQNELYKLSKLVLPKLGYKPRYMKFGDGYIGLEEYAPFDGIIVTAGAPLIPKPLLAQLKIGGKLVIPVGENIQIMTVLERVSEKEFTKKEYGEFRFVPLLKDKE
ncbi:MAG: protein-L-isoaspartate(D-aspartate) O-methyltransferase [Flavobacteriaceae bacterium]|nr:protein-L-isoaspartate(D-aspartate) O-methyltransferase [Flavobacteriaceae bacterium]